MTLEDVPAPLVVLVVAAVLALVVRWVFRPSYRPGSLPTDASEADDLGLLTVIRSAISRPVAREQRTRLGAAGIRASLSVRDDGSMDLLVFNSDAARARQLLAP